MSTLPLLSIVIGCGFVIWSGQAILSGESGWWVHGLLGVVMLAIGIMAGRPWAVEDDGE